MQTDCFGLKAPGPVVIVYPEATFYESVTPEDVDEIVKKHLKEGKPVERLVAKDAEKEQEYVKNLSLTTPRSIKRSAASF